MMPLYFMITLWAVLETLQDSEVSPRLLSPSALISYFAQAIEIFILLGMWSLIFYFSRAYFSVAENFLPAASLIFFYGYAKKMKRRETFVLMALAFSTVLGSTSLSAIFLGSLFTALGVTGIRLILKGIQKRQLFFPPLKMFSGFTEFFITSSLVALILSAVFVR